MLETDDNVVLAGVAFQRATHGQLYAVSRDSIYRHAHALGLMEKRRRNVRAALEKIIEKAGDVEVSATAVVSAVAAYCKD
jgi:hypothetical protein